jgi:DMSO reductase anchor subunit
MTTMMQASFGALAVLVFSRSVSLLAMTLVLALTSLALNVSVFHLGRPAYAWRALKMWRRSWLSREVLLFGLFFASVAACTICCWASTMGVRRIGGFVMPLAIMGVITGLSGTLASAYIYLVKARPSWNMIHTPLDFLFSAALIGTALVAMISAPANLLVHLASRYGLMVNEIPSSTHPLLITTAASAWVINHFIKIARLRQSASFERRASYNLLRGELLWWKVALSLLCAASATLFSVAPLPWMALLAAVTAVALGRYLFFVSVVPLSMGLTFLSKSHAAHGAA